MFRSIVSFSLSLVAGALLLASPAAAEPQYSRAPGAMTISHDDDNYGRWNERTCCQRNERWGYRVLWSTVGECRRTGGERVTNKTCRKHGGFHAYQRNDRRGGYDGHGGDGDGWQDGNAHDRVCCARDGQVWWSTRGECRRASGYQATNKTCRRN